VVSFGACVAHFSEGVTDLDVPYSPALLGAIDAFLEPEDMAFRDVKTRRGFHIYFFLKVSIKIGSLNIHLVYFKVAFSSKGKDSVEGREFGDRSKGLVKINAFDLGESLGDNAGFMLLYAAVRSTFDMKYPFAAYDFAAFQPRDDVVDIQVLSSLHFFFTGSEPLGSVRAGHGFIICLQLGGLGVSDIGTMPVGQDAIAWIVIGDRGTSGAFRARGDCGNGWSRNRSSGRWWSVVGFKDNVLVAWNGAPFVEYDITRLEKFVCGSVYKAKGAALLGKSEERAGQ
jgi:hypothetical protein